MKMTQQSKQDQQVEAAIEKFFRGVFTGMKKMISNPAMLLIFVLTTGACILVWYLKDAILLGIVPDGGISVPVILIHLVWVIPIVVLFAFGVSEPTDDVSEIFASIKFCNKAGRYPELIKKEPDGKKLIMSFRSPGLTLSDWRNSQSELETAFDCNIVKFEIPTHTKQIIKLHTVPAADSLSDNLPWSNDMVSNKDFVVTAGEALLGPVDFNLDKYPHALIAGVTGSGKSVILRSMLWQCILKGARPYMIDFKGGIEFKPFESFGEVIMRRDDALNLLKELVKEMSARLDLFRDVDVKNLTEYNHLHPDDELSRVVLVCDEVSEMLDKTGIQAADKAIYHEIEKEMSSISRLSRAAGIHMLLATQRPDARVIVGQIKNNLPIRISGRMIDTQASEMVLGNGKAANLGDTLGRFLYSVGSDTFEFQAYNFKDSAIIPGDYQRGRMLLEEEEREPVAEDHGEAEPKEKELCIDNEPEEIGKYIGF